MLKVNNIDVFYGEFQVLKNVFLKVNKGEFVIVLGPNGHGKSTLLKTISGLLTPSSGSITFNGKTITSLPTHKVVELGITYIAEDRHLFPEMTVYDNLRLGAYNIAARKNLKENFDYALSMFPKLKECRNQPASTLSGGEARMLAIGRGLMSNANFLAIDEPSLGLAPNLRADVFDKIGKINATGISILMVEQSVATQVLDLADRIYLVEDGLIVFDGCKEDALCDEHIKEVFLGTQ